MLYDYIDSLLGHASQIRDRRLKIISGWYMTEMDNRHGVAGFLEERVEDFVAQVRHRPKFCCRRIAVAIFARDFGSSRVLDQALKLWLANTISANKTHTNSPKQFAKSTIDRTMTCAANLDELQLSHLNRHGSL